jgi:hypothetical protein
MKQSYKCSNKKNSVSETSISAHGYDILHDFDIQFLFEIFRDK